MEKLKHNILKIYGKHGESWFSSLPRIIDQLKEDWKLSDLKPLANLSYSYVLEGFQNATPIILKFSPDAHLINQEVQSLHAFKGFGAVSVLGHREGVLLLERAIPGELLKNRYPQESRIKIACKVMEKLHQAPCPKETFPHIEDWLTDVDKEWNLPKEHLVRARTLKRDLLQKRSERQVLLHGDLHQENILSHENNWVVIDPKGVIGCPIHEVGACIEDPKEDIKFLSSYFGYQFQEVASWYYVRLILSACWQVEDGLNAGNFLTLAQSVLPLIES